MTEKLPEVWTSRDYPVLVEVTRRVDAGEDLIRPDTIAGSTGLDPEQVRAGLLALERRRLIRLDAKDTADRVGCARDVAGAAYLIAGLHPDGDDLAEQLVSALRQAAETTDDEDERGALKRAASALGNISGSVLAGVATAWITHQTGV